MESVFVQKNPLFIIIIHYAGYASNPYEKFFFGFVICFDNHIGRIFFVQLYYTMFLRGIKSTTPTCRGGGLRELKYSQKPQVD